MPVSGAPLGRARHVVLAAVVAVTVTVAALAGLSLKEKPRHPTNIILIVLDAMRADRLGCYGYTREIGGVKTSLTPNIDRLADRGALFENCVSQSNWTGTSMASLLYSVNPAVRPGQPDFNYLTEAGPYHCLLAAMTKAYLEGDYDKINVQTNPLLGQAMVTSLFDYIINVIPRPFRKSDYRLLGDDIQYGDAAAVNERAQGAVRLARRHGRSLFLYLHYMEAHEPYPWRGKYRALFDDGAVAPEDWGEMRAHAPKEYARLGRSGQYDPEFALRLQRVGNDCDASIMYLDEKIGELMAILNSEGLADNTLIILAADHGQAFGEHGNVGHGLGMYQEDTHVPLIIAGPRMPVGVRVGGYVRNLDIMPTICGYVGLNARCDGQDLLPLAQAAADHRITADREVFSCREYQGEPDPLMMRMLITPGRMKYIVTIDSTGDAVSEELYDLTADPGERLNLAAGRPLDVEAIRERVRQVVSPVNEPASVAHRGTSVLGPVTRERLMALGYLN